MNTTLHSIAFSQVPTGPWEEIQEDATEPPCSAIPAVASRGRSHRTPELEMPAPYFTVFPALKSSPQCHPAPSMPATSFLCLEVRCLGRGAASTGTGTVAGGAFIFLRRTVRVITVGWGVGNGEWRSSLRMTGGHLVFFFFLLDKK